MLGLQGCSGSTTFSSVLALNPGRSWGARPTQPCSAGRGRACPHLLWASLEFCSQLIMLGPQGPLLLGVWETVCNRLLWLSRGLQRHCTCPVGGQYPRSCPWAYGHSLNLLVIIHPFICFPPSPHRHPIHLPIHLFVHSSTHSVRPPIQPSAHLPTFSHALVDDSARPYTGL